MDEMKHKRYFCLGVCGMGMAPLAIYLKQMGCWVWGQDDSPYPPTQADLEQAGILWWTHTHTLPLVDEIIYSPAVPAHHPIRVAAEQAGIPSRPRGLFLSELTHNQYLIGIAGSHGKTTTTGLLIHALRGSGLNFSYLLGGLFKDQQHPPAYYCPGSPYIVAELDESDGTITQLHPSMLIVLNLDWDHPGYYNSEALLNDTFKQLVSQTTHQLIIPHGHPRLDQIAQSASCDIDQFAFGECPNTTYAATTQPTATGQYLNLTQPHCQRLHVPLVGDFNAHNALAALTAMHILISKIPDDPFGGFSGIKRRQDILFENETHRVMADYAHHPAEIKALLQAHKDHQKALWIVFQPHRYTRTALYAPAFADALKVADYLYLLPVYAASEPAFPEGQTQALQPYFPEHDHIYWVEFPDKKWLSVLAKQFLQQPAILFFIGAGDIEQIAFDFQSLIV